MLLAFIASLSLVLLPASASSADDAVGLLRLAMPAGPQTSPPLEAKKVKLGTATRNAIQVPPGFSFEVSPAVDWRQLIFSIGVGRADASSDGVEFVISGGKPGHWKNLFSQVVGADDLGWTDHRIDLEGLDPATDRLRFSTVAQSAVGAAEVSAYWGSVLIRSSESALPRGDVAGQGGPASLARGTEPIGARSAHGGESPNEEGGPASLARGAEPIGARSAHGGESPNEEGGPASLARGAEPIGARRAGGGESPTKPNVILISLDTLGANHVGWYGYTPSVSPILDEFLSRSFTFRKAYAQYPNTLVSHASLFSSLYPNHHRVYGFPATLRCTTLASILAAHGYFTAGITEDAYVSSDFGFDHGFDWYDDGMQVADEFPGNAPETFDKATEWLKRFGQEKPFFLFVHTYEVHTPYIIRNDEIRETVNRLDPGYSGPFIDMYPGGQTEVKHNRYKQRIPEPDIERMAALYAGEIEFLDGIFGRFMEEMSRLSVGKDTLVVVLADHGDEFNEHGKVGHGETLYNPVLHVPLAFYWPGRLEPGADATRVQLVDVAPTVLDLLGIDKPEDFDGLALTPLLFGQDDERPARPIFAELRSAWATCREYGLPDDCRSGHYAVQTERFKYYTTMIPWTENLYDLSTDPGETRDVANDFPQEVQRLRELLADYVIDAAPEPELVLPPGEGEANEGTAAPVLDETTRERLKALGYNP